ncbi:hypothetical protein PAXRUDRAFT_522711 [Paxillus rubicundulus Ve08.2h10]|uniref:Unplaced genomic scaffold scaffold_375, whole genome shotgun sequence n=1 Tax=Paxillus rubicundulus Ve08.2h10 TaxID=930991 RepID=A0A0D0E0H4_9AGAM|nr:hypothetical protein PAXRUDRAFT_522711 [Paxillus rubicundulus Ve08.2h10]
MDIIVFSVTCDIERREFGTIGTRQATRSIILPRFTPSRSCHLEAGVMIDPYSPDSQSQLRLQRAVKALVRPNNRFLITRTSHRSAQLPLYRTRKKRRDTYSNGLSTISLREGAQ